MTNHRGRRMREAGWEPTHPSDPKLRARDMEIDNIEVEVIYGIRFVEDSIRDPDVITATYRAYNDFIAEFCEHDPGRFIGIADIPAHSPDAAAAELRRIGSNGLGLKGALFDFFNGPGAHMARDVGTHVGRRGGGGSGAVLPHRRGATAPPRWGPGPPRRSSGGILRRYPRRRTSRWWPCRRTSASCRSSCAARSSAIPPSRW